MSKFIWAFLYEVFLLPFVSVLFLVVCLFRPKARETFWAHFWASFKWSKTLKTIGTESGARPLFWFHVSSVGEFLQATPVMSQLKKSASHLQPFILVTYFSPSLTKYLKSKNKPSTYWGFDSITVFPWDWSFFSKALLKTLQPKALVITKIDIWPSMVFQSSQNHTPVHLVSGTFSPSSLRKYIRPFYKNVLSSFKGIYCVSLRDRNEVLKFFTPPRALPFRLEVLGDTRLDSVVDQQKHWHEQIQSHTAPDVFYQISSLCEPHYTKTSTLVCGSLWENDLKTLCQWLKHLSSPTHFRNIIIAPHEINPQTLKLFLTHLEAVGFKAEQSNDPPFIRLFNSKLTVQIILVNRLGLLSGLYSLGQVAFVGTGYGGVHNTLEPSAWGNTVIVGPKYQNAPEVSDLINVDAAYSYKSARDFSDYLSYLSEHPKVILEKGQKAKLYVDAHKGSSHKCVVKISDNNTLEATI